MFSKWVELSPYGEVFSCFGVCNLEASTLFLGSQAHTKSDPIKILLSRSVLFKRIAKLLLLLGEFNISVVQTKAINSQALSDLLTYFPSQFEEIILNAILAEFHEKVCVVDVK